MPKAKGSDEGVGDSLFVAPGSGDQQAGLRSDEDDLLERARENCGKP